MRQFALIIGVSLLFAQVAWAAPRFVLTFESSSPTPMERWNLLEEKHKMFTQNEWGCAECLLSAVKSYGRRLVVQVENAKHLDVVEHMFVDMFDGQGLLFVEDDPQIHADAVDQAAVGNG